MGAAVSAACCACCLASSRRRARSDRLNVDKAEVGAAADEEAEDDEADDDEDDEEDGVAARARRVFSSHERTSRCTGVSVSFFKSSISVSSSSPRTRRACVAR